MSDSGQFQQQIQQTFQQRLDRHRQKAPETECLRMDLHCHDCNSDVTDELLGRILRFPETWLQTGDLVNCLKEHRCDVITITNHNNARSCWELMETGRDILPGGEFTCCFKKFDTHLHVLAYGFTPAQEETLNRLRNDLPDFLTYAAAHDIPTVLPHPLYVDAGADGPDPVMYEHLALMFDRFEVLNGQRDVWQNLLTWEWLDSLTEERIDLWQKKHGIQAKNFCRFVYDKQVTGGSDDHMGLFAGTCGTALHVPDLEKKRKQTPLSLLALEAIRSGAMHPYGQVFFHEKLNIAFMDYLSQIALHMKEPGLFRMFLHKGSLREKLICLGFSNAMQELRRHRFTLFFFRSFHEALHGRRPGLISRFKVTPDFRPLIRTIDEIARAKHRDREQYMDLLKTGSSRMFSCLNQIIARRIASRAGQMENLDMIRNQNPADLIQQLEIPSHVRALFEEDSDPALDHGSRINLSDFFDALTFPVLAWGVIAGASLLSTRVLMGQRAFVNGFARSLGRHVHPRRVLWLTDTLGDNNGVSASLSRKLSYIQERDLPIDFLVCHDRIREAPHLKVVPPVGSFTFPGYPEQVFHVPDLLAVQSLFIQGGYDRIMCSTELLMGLVALFLKQSMAVPVYFFMHTDWLTFFRHTMELPPPVMDRIRRMLRAFYHQFDGIFALNRDHRDWLTGPAIAYDGSRVHNTAHWVDERFRPLPGNRRAVFGERISETDIVVLYAGRLSEEKGVFDLPEIMDRLDRSGVKVRLVIAGTGPAEDRLKALLPDALFLGWVARTDMPALYSRTDMLVLPSRFDTFGNVILEAMSCGAAVAAYAEKGPLEIIQTRENGILAKDPAGLADGIARFARDETLRHALKKNSLRRAKAFSRETIFEALLTDLGLTDHLSAPLPKTETMKAAIGY
ncbi:MAG: glycosyltransferase [Desulfotignum sp.]|nr:glycosyltransferase [Desulfotignum sp.]